MQLRDRTIAVSDTRGQGTPIFLAHGFALDGTMFAHQAELGPQRRIISWDSPGHGNSPIGTTPFTFWDLADVQTQLMDEFGIDRAIVGGVSQGGFTALRTALTAPSRVAALLLIDTEAGALDPADAAAYSELFAALEEHGPTIELTTALASQIVGDHPLAEHWAKVWSERGVPLGAPVDCLTQRDDVTSRLSEINAPALIIAGEHDHSIPIERQEQMRQRLANATKVNIIAGAGHSPTATHPAQVNAVIEQFLAEAKPLG
ncbi:alpha/beta fold hydrolase [Pseudonocardia sp. ICBG162]|uniref:alpha/beta fold hydrolase n=1 Tax=Pseudonocardia sp. ICBG162 TaxID=2846761 RepID=UPI001CF6CC33|nr:alpha/beta hydrolase [Pseudonocardia sp. ICBG162]